jgi:DNA polymerase-3 subunit gamma/tau
MAGLSFAPPASPDRRSQQQNASALSPTQQALQVLSLHLPRILGARAISPSSLLTPQPGGASPVSPDAAVLQSALQAGPGALGAPTSPLAPSVNTAPSPVNTGASPTAAQAVAALIQSALQGRMPSPVITPGGGPQPTQPPTNGPIVETGPTAPPPAPAPPAPVGGSGNPIRWGNLGGLR